MVGTIVNKKGMFTNLAKQYLKSTNTANAEIYPLLTEFMDFVNKYSKANNFSTADTTEFIEYTLYTIICTRYPEDTPLVYRPFTNPKIETLAEIFANEFASKFNLGTNIE